MTAFERIITKQVPDWAAKFDIKNRDYNSGQEPGEALFEPHRVLGVKGQFADVWRKIWKLKKALWDGATLTGEQPKEIIQDLISHLFLTLDLLEEQEDKSLRAFETTYPGVTEGERPLALIDDSSIPPGMAVVGLPDGGDREGPRRLGITPDEWEELKKRADDVNNGSSPVVLESKGFILIKEGGEGVACNDLACSWTRTSETHSYQGECAYRIRPRRTS